MIFIIRGLRARNTLAQQVPMLLLQKIRSIRDLRRTLELLADTTSETVSSTASPMVTTTTEKWCEYHQTFGHSTSQCRAVRMAAAQQQYGGYQYGPTAKPPRNTYRGRPWRGRGQGAQRRGGRARPHQFQRRDHPHEETARYAQAARIIQNDIDEYEEMVELEDTNEPAARLQQLADKSE